MEYRWVGAFLIIAACSGCGFSVAAGKRKEERLLYQLLEVLQYMEADLRYRMTPLPDLCRKVAGNVTGILRVVFMNLFRELSWQKLPDAGSCMMAAIQRTGEMPGRIRRLLVLLGQTLGQFDLDGQLLGIQTVRRRCEESLESIRKNRDERLRSYRTLGICAGAALTIILL